ncbi:hypothetical protein STA3757_13220 [Stanieria sp. NIES-3757]|nr:hypothetical protein STA3757_13220 [Stanieria sp. NIES-3757]
MVQIIIITIAVTQFNFLPSALFLTVTKSSIINSLQKDFDEERKKTEFVDDDTEKMLNKHKKWFVLMIVGFSWLTYKSLFSSQNK